MSTRRSETSRAAPCPLVGAHTPVYEAWHVLVRHGVHHLPIARGGNRRCAVGHRPAPPPDVGTDRAVRAHRAPGPPRASAADVARSGRRARRRPRRHPHRTPRLPPQRRAGHAAVACGGSGTGGAPSATTHRNPGLRGRGPLRFAVHDRTTRSSTRRTRARSTTSTRPPPGWSMTSSPPASRRARAATWPPTGTRRWTPGSARLAAGSTSQTGQALELAAFFDGRHATARLDTSHLRSDDPGGAGRGHVPRVDGQRGLALPPANRRLRAPSRRGSHRPQARRPRAHRRTGARTGDRRRCAPALDAGRLAAAAERGAISDEGAATLREAHRFLLGLRLRHQLAAVRQGREPSETVSHRELRAIEVRHLKDAFRAIRDAQEALALKVPDGQVLGARGLAGRRLRS